MVCRKVSLSFALFIALTSVAFLPASAQHTVNPNAVNAEQTKTVASSNVRASSLVGLMATNREHAQLGRVHDLIFDWKGERLQYLVLAVRNGLADTEELTAYPSNRFQIGSWEDQLLLDASEGGIKIQAGDKDASPLLHSLKQFSGTADRALEQAADRHLGLLSIAALLGATVINVEGREVGELNDLVVSLPDGKIRYVAMDPVATFNMKNRLLVLPVRAMQPEPMRARRQEQKSQALATGPVQNLTEGVEFRLAPGLDEERLSLGRTVNKEQWPKVNGPHIKDEMNSYVLSSFWPWHGSNAAGNNGSGAKD
jgi:sporulation protein YlmC with PRC-barrel domain